MGRRISWGKFVPIPSTAATHFRGGVRDTRIQKVDHQTNGWFFSLAAYEVEVQPGREISRKNEPVISRRSRLITGSFNWLMQGGPSDPEAGLDPFEPAQTKAVLVKSGPALEEAPVGPTPRVAIRLLPEGERRARATPTCRCSPAGLVGLILPRSNRGPFEKPSPGEADQ